MTSTAYELDEIIRQNSNLVYSVCAKYQNYFDKEDLYQEGKMGLIDAYENFDETKNVKFSTYAFPYVVGKVSNYVRENKNIKISRDLIRLGRKIGEYIDKHKQVRGYEPSTKDIALMLEIKEEKVISALDASKIATKSLDEELNDTGRVITLLDVTPKEEKISKEQMLDLKEAFKYLSENEKELIINRYFNDLTQSEVAELMGVNQVYVSRMEKKVLTKMKKKMSIVP